MVGLTAYVKADAVETDRRYSASEWVLDPGQEGVGLHRHDENEEIFLILEGTPELFLGDRWALCPTGTFLRVSAGVIHDFRNLRSTPARFFSMFLGGVFEPNMPAIVEWFAAQASKE